MGHAAECFDIIDDGWFAEQAFDGGEGGFDARPRALAFKAFDQSGFFAADVGPGTAMQDDVEVEAGAMNVPAEDPGSVAFANGSIQNAVAGAVLVSKIKIGAIGPNGVAGENDALDQLMRVLFHQVAVVEGAGFAFISVDGKVDRSWVILWKERPFKPGGKSGATSTAEA